MKKRLFILCLCLCLLLCALPADVMADSKISFISINDTLPPELINCFTYYGGTIYVPAWLFASYGFGIFYSYTADDNSARLYNGGGELSFYLSSGETVDDGGNRYTLSAITVGGSVYVPLSYVASYFGTFSYSTIGTEYGTVLRLKDSRAWLTDAEFVKPAENLLKQYYNAYNKDNNDDSSQTAPEQEDSKDHEGTDILIGFAGLPDDENLRLLEDYGVKGCFFLTADQVRADPDRVRRLACQGYRLGVLWEGEGSYEETSELIFEAARVKTVMLAAAGEYAEQCAAEAQEKSLIYFEHSIEALHGPEEDISPYTVTSAIEIASGEGDISLLLNSGTGMDEMIGIVLNYLRTYKFDLLAPSEILY